MLCDTCVGTPRKCRHTNPQQPRGTLVAGLVFADSRDSLYVIGLLGCGAAQFGRRYMGMSCDLVLCCVMRCYSDIGWRFFAFLNQLSHGLVPDRPSLAVLSHIPCLMVLSHSIRPIIVVPIPSLP